MKKKVVVTAFCCAFIAFVVISLWNRPEHKLPARIPDRSERSRMSVAERVKLLENLGVVPVDADQVDYDLAQKTTWWGKPIDTKTFWTNKVVWCDSVAVYDAQRYGHMWPPIPCADASLSNLPAQNKGIIESDHNREAVYWDMFRRSHPLPPDEITRVQKEIASTVLRSRRDATKADDRDANRNKIDSRFTRTGVPKHYLGLGYPPECYEDDALFWAYVIDRRSEYSNMSCKVHARQFKSWSNTFVSHLCVDVKFILEQLTVEDMKKADEWKVRYLRRLRAEKTDESYIGAYLREWNLNAADVFCATNACDAGKPLTSTAVN